MGVVFPGVRGEGMACLALHQLYRLINGIPRFMGERLFYDGAAPRSVEGDRPAGEFRLLAVTLPGEEHAARLPHFLKLAGIPPRSAARKPSDPLILVGGIAVRLNPRPLLPFVDAFVPGDAEPVMGPLLQGLEGNPGRDEVLAAWARIQGVGVPAAGALPVRARFDASGEPVAQVISEADTSLPGIFLVETGRGCPAGCRFCAIGFSRRPPVFFDPARVAHAAAPGVERGLRIGLVGASLSLHPGLPDILEQLPGADLSVASLQPSFLAGPAGAALLRRLQGGSLRRITLALEAGSESLKRKLNKGWDRAALLEAVARVGEAGALGLKLYLMYGLPEEEDTDLEEAVALVAAVRHRLHQAHRGRGRTGSIAVSANPFVPKPHTPFAGEPMAPLRELRRRRDLLFGGLRCLGGVEVSGASPREALLQCLLDRADEGLATILERTEGRWPPRAEIQRELQPEIEQRVLSPFRPDRAPVDLGVDPAFLARERERARGAFSTPACIPASCRACGACGEPAEPTVP